MKEIKSLTGLRGIASLWVILLHFTIIYTTFISENLLPKYIENAITNGYLAVDLFFILSGFVLSISMSSKLKTSFSINDFKAYIMRRFSRIYPLYIILITIYFIINKLTHITQFKFGFLDFISNALLIQSVTPYNYIINAGWSLSVEWLIYFLFPIIFLYLHKSPKKLLLITVISFTIISICSSNGWINGYGGVLDHTRGGHQFYVALHRTV